MKARLLFSISMSLDPDILVVDEALATGDSHFIQKSSKRVREICRSGATILLVSHNMNQIESLCQRVLVLDKGEIVADTDPVSAHRLYSEMVFKSEKEYHPLTLEASLERTGGTGEVLVSKVTLLDEQDHSQTGFLTFQTLKVRLDLSVEKERREVFLFIGFLDAETGTYVGGVNTKRYYDSMTEQITSQPISVQTKTIVEVIFSPLFLFTGHYLLWIEVADRYRNVFSDYKGICPFFVSEEGAVVPREAYFNHPMRMKVLEKRRDSQEVETERDGVR